MNEKMESNYTDEILTCWSRQNEGCYKRVILTLSLDFCICIVICTRFIYLDCYSKSDVNKKKRNAKKTERL